MGYVFIVSIKLIFIDIEYNIYIYFWIFFYKENILIINI